MAQLDWSGMAGITYECCRCHYRFRGEELIQRDRVTCPVCGYRIIKKLKPPVVHRIKAI